MKNLKVFLLVCLVTILGAGCRELPLGPLEGDCSDLPPSDSPIGYRHEDEFPFRYGPCFNPNNGNEFTYVEYLENPSRSDLYRYNLETREKTLLVPSIISIGNWSSSNWIILTGTDGRLRKIKGNGDSLTVISNPNSEMDPIWNPDGSRIAVRRLSPGADVRLILDKDGNVADSLPIGSLKPLCWLEADKIYGEVNLDFVQNVGYTTRTIGYFDLNTRQLVPIYEIGDYFDSKTGRVNMTGDREKRILYWTNLSGFYRTEIETGKTVLLLQNCQTRNRAYLSVSPDGERIIADLAINKKVGENTIRSSVMLVEYDVNGIEQQVFDF